MEFLSLEDPVEVPTVRVSRSEAILLSLGLHLLLVLLFLFGPGVASRVLPESILALLGARPPSTRDLYAVPEDSEKTASKPENRPKIPLKFAYVRTPDDHLVKGNPAAKILSDKSRKASQEIQTPPKLKEFSIDPHSEGTTVERIRPDPRLAEGKDAVDPVPPGTDASRDKQQANLLPPADGSGAAEESDTGQSGKLGREGGGPPSSAVEGTGTLRGGPGLQGGPGTANRISAAARGSLQRVLSGQGEESKRLFDNPGYLSPGFTVGTMSFDTQDFPWGDYARRIKVIIDNGWSERLPLAFRDGVRGYLCVHFFIQKDGTISGVQVVLPSSVPPFNRAVLGTLSSPDINPLPPLPEGFPEEQEGLSWCFFYNMLPGEIRELMR